MKYFLTILLVSFILMPFSALSSSCCCEDNHSSDDCSTCLVHICKCSSMKISFGNVFIINELHSNKSYPKLNLVNLTSLFSPASLERPPKYSL